VPKVLSFFYSLKKNFKQHNIKKCRPPYRFLPVGLNMWHAVERGGYFSILKSLTRKRQAGDDSFFGTFFLLKKESTFMK